MCFGGPSSAQEQSAANMSDLENQFASDFALRFSQQNDALSKLASMISPSDPGWSTPGMSGQELSLRNAAIVTATGANYSNAAKALGVQLGARGGGNVSLPSGSEDVLRGTLLGEAAGIESEQQNRLMTENYDLGRKLQVERINALTNTLGAYNPLGYAGAATSAGKEAFQEQTTVQQMKNQKASEIAGAIGSLAMGAVTFGAGALAGGIGGGLSALATGGGSLMKGVTGGGGSTPFDYSTSGTSDIGGFNTNVNPSFGGPAPGIPTAPDTSDFGSPVNYLTPYDTGFGGLSQPSNPLYSLGEGGV